MLVWAGGGGVGGVRVGVGGVWVRLYGCGWGCVGVGVNVCGCGYGCAGGCWSLLRWAAGGVAVWKGSAYLTISSGTLMDCGGT